MARTLLVVDSFSDWAPYYPSDQLITFETYLETEQGEPEQRVRVINLCRSYSYLSDGYYCSLLAEARGHNVSPSVKVLSDLDRGEPTDCNWKICPLPYPRLSKAKPTNQNYPP